jgi:hypothetical protein
MLGAALLIMGVGAAAAVDPFVLELSPHAAIETVNRAAAVIAVNFAVRISDSPFRFVTSTIDSGRDAYRIGRPVLKFAEISGSKERGRAVAGPASSGGAAPVVRQG